MSEPSISPALLNMDKLSMNAQQQNLYNDLTNVLANQATTDAALTEHKSSNDHDARYYTESEIDATVSTLTTNLNTHKSSSDHDGRYYTETEINNLLLEKQQAIDYIRLEHRETAGTDAGSFTAGSWVTRVLTTEVSDPGGNCSLASNRFTLVAGTYEMEAMVPARGVEAHQAILYNYTDSVTTLTGTSEYSTSAHPVITWSNIKGLFTISNSKTFEIRHRCSATNSAAGALGTGCGFTTEIYTQVVLRKLA
jgi:hypothetical protein